MRRFDRYIEEVEENKYSRVSKNEHLLKELEVGIGRDNEEEETFSRSEKTEDSDTIGFSDNIDLEGYNLKNYIRKAKENVKENDGSLVANQFSYLEELNKKYYENYEKEKAKEIEEKDLFSDLMIDEKEENDTVAHDIEEKKKEVTEEEGKLINSFYTRSMDLSKDDFVSAANKEVEEKPKKNNFLIFFIILLIIILIIGVLYYTGVFKNIGIKL